MQVAATSFQRRFYRACTCFSGNIRIRQDRGGKLAFFLLELVYALIDGFLAEELLYKYRVVLTDGVGESESLNFRPEINLTIFLINLLSQR